jgi:integrase
MVGRTVPKKVGRALHKLTDRQVKTADPGYHGDGGGLWLQVSAARTRSWIFRYTLNGRAREMGLGALHTLSLAEAREKSRQQRQLLLDGIDPIDARNATRRTVVAQAAKIVTFQAEAEAYIEAHRAGWKNAKHVEQWQNTLATYAYPHIGKLAVSEIETAHVMLCLEPIWTSKTETAKRVRGRIEAVLDRATALKHRSGDNPARWRGHLVNLLAKPSSVAPTEHHAALPYTQIGAFMKDLRAQDGVAARALEFAILTATRTGETIGAQWREIDLAAGIWTVPAARMKSKKAHRVPLSKPAVKLLQAIQGADKLVVFPGRSAGKGLSNMAMLKLLQQRMGRIDLTVHGFRSTFRDWAAEQSNFPNEVIEMALAHTIEDATEAAYRRGDLYEKRARLMQAWADYCGRVQTDATVTPIRASRGAS